MRFLLCGINAKYIHSNLAIFSLKAYADRKKIPGAEIILKEYTIYEKIINLCDLMCTTKLQSLEQRLIDLLLRHGVYKNTHYHLIEVYKLKENLDNLLGYNLYNLFPEIKENL